ncbi:hypothetical protein DVH24_025311 [Malus domestica]|uniref:Uncharacterized protein n=1 Tax=Malus domestica TaxID=3750 RepID=A0A498HM56_MALDO|nr:hypothetical protein DVH24_025311 [Malus domestica]
MSLRVYGKGPNRNKLVVHTMYRPANRTNPPKEKIPMNDNVLQRFLGFFRGMFKFDRLKKVGVLLFLLASAATTFWVLNVLRRRWFFGLERRGVHEFYILIFD